MQNFWESLRLFLVMLWFVMCRHWSSQYLLNYTSQNYLGCVFICIVVTMSGLCSCDCWLYMDPIQSGPVVGTSSSSSSKLCPCLVLVCHRKHTWQHIEQALSFLRNQAKVNMSRGLLSNVFPSASLVLRWENKCKASWPCQRAGNLHLCLMLCFTLSYYHSPARFCRHTCWQTQKIAFVAARKIISDKIRSKQRLWIFYSFFTERLSYISHLWWGDKGNIGRSVQITVGGLMYCHALKLLSHQTIVYQKVFLPFFFH